MKSLIKLWENQGNNENDDTDLKIEHEIFKNLAMNMLDYPLNYEKHSFFRNTYYYNMIHWY